MLTIEEIKRFIEEDANSKRKKDAKKGIDYYEARHDIKDYKVYFMNDDGFLEEDTTKNNSRISHPFFTELVDQCTQYLLSGEDGFIKSDIPELQKLLKEYFNDEFEMELNDLLTYTQVEGFSYLYRYVGNDFKSKFRFADAFNVVEVPSKYASDKQDHTIYKYFYKKEKDKDIFKVEVWDSKNVYFYTMREGKVEKDTEEKINPRPHIIFSEKDKKYADSFNDIPFIRLDNNRKQYSDLKVTKDLIDDYDIMSCGLSNNIQDLSEGFYVIKGFQGSDTTELTQAVKAKKQIAVDENGDFDIKTVNIPYEARKTKLELDEANIYKFGMGIDTSKVDASGITNVAIKLRYTLLDLKANKKEQQLRKMMKKVIKIVLDEINKENNTAYKESDVYMQFDRVVPTNELDNANIELIEANKRNVEITTLLNVATKLDDETLLKNICNVLDIDYEEIKDKLPEAVPSVAEATQTLLES